MHPSILRLYPSFHIWVQSSFSNVTTRVGGIDDKSYNFSSDMEHYEDSKSKSGSTCTDGLIREYNKDESQIENITKMKVK